jgi:hypothetical protein
MKRLKAKTKTEYLFAKKTILFVFSWIFILVGNAYSQTQIDAISFDIQGNMIIISNDNEKILERTLDDSSLTYEYIITNPFFEITGWDGVVDLNKSKDLKKFPGKNIKKEDFVKFPFLSEQKDTIGILTGRAGATGRSSQEVYFINVKTGVFIKLPMQDMEEISWLKENGNIAGYIKHEDTLYFGPSSTRWGYKARPYEVILFDQNGDMTTHSDAFKQLVERAYKKIHFSAEEKEILRENVIYSMKYRDLGEKLLDFIYYGYALGREDEVMEFLNKINPIYAKETKKYYG